MEHSPERRREPRLAVDADVWILGWTGLRRGRLGDASSASLGIALRGRAPARGTRVLVFLPTPRKLRWPAVLLARVVHRDENLGVAFTSIPRGARPWLRRLIESASPGDTRGAAERIVPENAETIGDNTRNA
ncbi:MAG: PilZ domain-containing protein [Deltaproteobacteria bacterium]|nr:PilZ domain-containing protein [Deltaproteobacteria bacterium]MBW2392759.1 PilZ domain-containing protein [Deltaproteobacteria bacterium]